MHEGGAFTWREVVDKYHSALIAELSESLHTEIDQAVSSAICEEQSKATALLADACQQATDAAREAAWHEAREAAHHVAQETARKEAEAARLAVHSAMTAQFESLNQLLRRLRAASEKDILELVAKGCFAYAAQLVVLVFESNQARVAAHQGVTVAKQDGAILDESFLMGTVCFDINDAPAILSAIESRDQVVALSTPSEISPSLASLFQAVNLADTAKGGKAYLFPIRARHSVVAMLIASGVDLSTPVELICEAAGMRFESLASNAIYAAGPNGSTQAAVPTPDVPASATAGPQSWDDLSSADQKLHLQAQRMARVAVAEMRLYQQNELRSGLANSNIYGSLQSAIDAARSEFLQTFLSKSLTMVDYLHLEIMRSLAHEDDRLLGHNYPGPMV
jgi:hypothetical protein